MRSLMCFLALIMFIAPLTMLPSAAYAHPAASQSTIVATILQKGSSKSVTLQAHTRIGSTCSLTETDLATSQVQPIGTAQHVGQSGIIKWTWAEPSRPKGAIATVHCTWKGQGQTVTVSVVSPRSGVIGATDPRVVAFYTLLTPFGPLMTACGRDMSAMGTEAMGLKDGSSNDQDVRATAKKVAIDCLQLEHALQRYGASEDAIQAALKGPLKGNATVADVIWQMRRLANASLISADQFNAMLGGSQTGMGLLLNSIAIAKDAGARFLSDLRQLQESWHLSDSLV